MRKMCPLRKVLKTYLMLGTTRGLYSVAVRGEGPNPKMFSQVDETTNMPTNSSIFGLLALAGGVVVLRKKREE